MGPIGAWSRSTDPTPEKGSNVGPGWTIEPSYGLPRSFLTKKGHKTDKIRLQRPVFGSGLGSWAGKSLMVNPHARYRNRKHNC